MIYIIDCFLGNALVDARSPKSAEKYMRVNYGLSNGPYVVKRADESDIEWVRGMGGRIHQAGGDE